MTVQDLEAQLLQLSPVEKLHIIQLLAQSLNADVVEQQTDRDEKLSDFFRQSPLAQAVANSGVDLERDRRHSPAPSPLF
ncbi:hypothetical protein IQ254_23285 [Nodosilinea sp. LEGE 07088]|uniref:hypothetical protein n=1 Tax=Nodosilinea sp. LEGE 07088 TaxID=2777968 RepID=UPI0018808F2F|nr:hypothetical protein [Nodosilinea sp. LEGE 07088]MBE9140083.1 hypothetical protein [Nodosilinea sp. LEGE 07088]